MIASSSLHKFLLSAASVLISFAASAITPSVRDVDIKVRLTDDGTARITERWDVTVSEGTEWYLVRDNLDDITIYGLEVSENGRNFIDEGEWKVSRTLEEKAAKCGIVTKGNGCEICWGIGNYGDHTFIVSYSMARASKALDDYDIFHVQLVSPGLSSPPLHVRAEISLNTAPLDTTNARIWGFGFYGEASFSSEGSIILESSEPFVRNSSLIALLRLDKGVIHPVSVRQTTFSAAQEKAFEGSAYQEEYQEPSIWMKLYRLLLGILFPILFILIPVKIRRKAIMNILGTHRKKDIGWSREIPYEGDLASANYILGKLGERRSGNNVASAMILRMLQKGCLSVSNDPKGKTEITFGNEAALSQFGASERKLWEYMKLASGSDRILQDKEFSRWSAKHKEEINDWLTKLSAEGEQNLTSHGFKLRGKYTEAGQTEARKALGLKKFLTDYTLIKERASREVALWQEYLVFGAMLGIADKVASELKDINPTIFQEATIYDYTTTRNVIRMSDSLARSITNAKARYDRQQMSSSSRGGFGGHTSFGGGGGFSGGGFGGGSR